MRLAFLICFFMLSGASALAKDTITNLHFFGKTSGSTAQGQSYMISNGKSEAKKLCERKFGYSVSEEADYDCESGYHASCKVSYSTNCQVTGHYVNSSHKVSVDKAVFLELLETVGADQALYEIDTLGNLTPKAIRNAENQCESGYWAIKSYSDQNMPKCDFSKDDDETVDCFVFAKAFCAKTKK